jgi:hypothetical protein
MRQSPHSGLATHYAACNGNILSGILTEKRCKEKKLVLRLMLSIYILKSEGGNYTSGIRRNWELRGMRIKKN